MLLPDSRHGAVFAEAPQTQRRTSRNMPILKTIPTAAAILSVFASVSAAQTTFLVSLNKEGIFFGDPLTVTVFVTPWAEETLNPTVGLVIPNNFTFRKADIRVTVCQEPTSCDTHQASINGNSTVASGPEVVFENRVIDGSKSIVLIQNETGWEPRTSFRCVVQFDSVWSSDIDQNTHFVIGRLYHAKMVSNGDDTNETMVHVEHVSGKHLSISPVSMNISLDGISPNHNNDSKAIFHYVEVSAVIDRRVGDALIRLPISTDLTITQAGYTMGHGSQSMIDLSVPADNELSILLNQFAFDELASHWCQMNRCELTLIAVVVTEPRNRQGVFSHQQVSVKATVFYGANFKSRVDSETVFISLPGGEDMNNGSNAEEPDEGSGPPANNGSITTVSEDDETNATTLSTDMDPSFQIGGNDNVIDPGPADIGQPENITVGYVPEVIPNDDLHEIDLAIDENATSIDQPPNTDHMELEETMEATNESLETGSVNKTRMLKPRKGTSMVL